MKIKTRYFYAEKGKYHCGDDYMVLKNRQIISPLSKADEPKNTRPFYYDDTTYDIVYGSEEKKQKIEINRLITEAHYTTKQQEYLARLTWLQRQKLLWMFKRHWLQRPGNMIHLLIVGLMLTLAFAGYRIVHGGL